MTILAKRKKQIKKIQEDLDKMIEKSFQEVIKERFDRNPNLFLITWTQYTPSFNDGDVCRFRLDTVFEIDLHPEKLEKLPKNESGETITFSEEDLYDKISYDELDYDQILSAVYGERGEEDSDEEEEDLVELLKEAIPSGPSDLEDFFQMITDFLDANYENARIYVGRDLKVHVESYYEG